MKTWIRTNGAGEFKEARAFPEGSDPVDIPHKDVVWREQPAAPPAGDVPGPERKVSAENILRAKYRERIVDALPDLGAVTELAAERDREIVKIRGIKA